MAYIGVSPQFGVRRKHTYTATAGQTSFSGAGSEGATLSYKDSTFVDVYQNGIKLGDADYTSTSGTAIVLLQGASVSDLIEIVVFDVFSVADTVSKADGGTFDGNVTMGGTLGVTGNVTMGGTLGVTGVPTFTGRSVHSGGITVANGGQIGSVGDADAMAISSSGVVTFTQPPVGAGGLVLLQTVTASADSTLDVGSSSLFTSTYKVYQIHLINVHPSTNGAHFACRMGTAGSIVSTSGSYEYTRDQVLHGGNNIRGSAGAGIVDLAESIGSEDNECMHQVHTLYNPAGTTFKKLVNFYGVSSDLTPNFAMNNGMYGNKNFVTAIDRIQFSFTSGTIQSGVFKLYGVV